MDNIFTELIHSTTSIQGKFKNLFLEEDKISLYKAEGNIVCIESNYGTVIKDGYIPKIVKKNSKGSKKIIKVYIPHIYNFSS